MTEAVTPKCSVKKEFLEISQNTQESTCARVSFLINFILISNFIKKETLAQVFSCEFYEIFKNTFFIEQLRWLLAFWSQCLSLKILESTAKPSKIFTSFVTEKHE